MPARQHLTSFDGANIESQHESDIYGLQPEDSRGAPEPQSEGSDEGSYEILDDGAYIGGWTQDDLPYEDTDIAAVQQAAEALQDSSNPLGLDPRVAALRAQLSDLFGVSLEQRTETAGADQPDTGQEDSIAAEPAAALDESVITESESASFAAADVPVEETAPSAESDPVRSWLAYLQNRNSPATAAPVETSPAPAAPAPVKVSTAPVTEVPPVKTSEPLIRQNKSAVRLEISHLRDIANRHTRGVLAVKASEQKARLLWFMSGAGMVVLCFVSMALLKSPNSVVRWCGWAFLCGAAVSLAVCVNSFQKLKSTADTEEPDETVPATDRPAHEITSSTASELLTPEMEARLEALIDPSAAEQPREVNV
jgi:hypothetical protein